MRHLLEFLCEHSLDERLYCVLPAEGGELELSWRAAEPHQWEVRHASSGSTVQVSRADLIRHLTDEGADLALFERELSSLVSAHIVVADHLLRAACKAFGSDGVDAVLRGQQQFERELRQAVRSLLTPGLRLVR